ncbi:MAG: hypothetical protein J0I08_24165 [Rhizobiales bacterium]|nr:hypothetical protein [Hyphomicrobiales bacterium]
MAEMLARALKVLDYSLPEQIRTLTATAALNQPGDEDGAYGRGSGERQRDSAIPRKSDFAIRPSGPNVPPP